MDRAQVGDTVTSPDRLIDVLHGWARSKPQAAAVSLLGASNQMAARWTFAEIERGACGVAAALQAAGLSGRPVLLSAEPTLEFIAALCGCLYAGAIATPVPPLTRRHGFERLQAIIANAGITHAVVTGPGCTELRARCSNLHWVDTTHVQPYRAIEITADTPALLQYTSGSTGAPKGAVVTHGNLFSNLQMQQAAFAATEHSRVLSWLPLFHDMGLIANLLFALQCGAQLYLLAARQFVQNPLQWLTALSQHRIHISGAPNFAFELCARRAPALLSEMLDLSCWSVAYCGAEPVRSTTLREFAEVFRPHGLAASALMPCYGLAEATVYVSGGPPGNGLRVLGELAAVSGSRAQAVSCGCPGATVAIVDPATQRRVAEGEEGEVWVRGPHVAAGYWNNADVDVFGAHLAGEPAAHYLRSGDFGLLCQGHLFITGRLKNVIIHRGAKLHCEDIEQTIAQSDARFAMTGAVFGIESRSSEEVVAAFEVIDDPLWDEQQQMMERALSAVAQQHGVRLFDLILTPAGTLPRTTSGKVRREACREQYLGGQLQSRHDRAVAPSLGIHQSMAH